MRVLADKPQEILEDLPASVWADPATQALVKAVGNELQRIEDFLMEIRVTLSPTTATGTALAYWEGFLGLPKNPEGATEDERRAIVKVAIARRSSGIGSSWVGLLDQILAYATWQHSENSDSDGLYSPYQLAITDVAIPSDNWRTGIFWEAVQRTRPAHLTLSEIEIAGDDTFRVGISEVGDEL